MIENYINTVETIRLHLYFDGQPTSADELPTATAEDLDGNPVALSVVIPQTVAGPPTYDYYEVSIEPEELTTFRQIKITWDYLIQNKALKKIELVNVVEPYFFADDLWGHNPDLSPQGATPKSIDEVKKVESLVRNIVDAYCRQSFQNFGRKSKTYIGSGSNILELGDRLYKLYSVDSTHVNLFKREDDDSVSTSIVSWNKDIPWQISKTTEGDNFYGEVKADVTPGLLSHRKTFKSSTYYTVDADFGWEFVPIEVKQAAVIIANDYMCEDDIYHQKNITVVRSADFRMEFAEDHHATTGNVYADQLLSDFVNTGVSVI